MLKALARNGGVMQMCFLSAYVRKPDPNPARDKAAAGLRAKYGDFRKIKDDAVLRRLRQEFEALEAKWPEKKASVADVVDHIDHVVKTVGIDYVGIGTDFDGGGGVAGCEDVSGMIRVTEELLRRGYSEPEIAKIWGENFFRVFRAAAANVK